MADTQTKILEVIVDNNKAIASISEYNRLIDEQKQKQAQLAVELKQGAISQADYYKEVAKSKEEVKAYSRSMQELSKEVQNNIKDAQEQDGSLRSLRAQLSNLTKEFDALSRAERQGDAGKAKMEEINRITNELKEAEAETQRFYRNVGNYPDVKPLETQLGEIRQQLSMLKYEGKDNTEEFKELAAKASNMKDALADVEQQINATASDSKNLDTAIMGLSTAMGGLSLLGNIFADGSEEGKKFADVMQKAQMAMAALNTLRLIQINTQKQSLLYQTAEKVQLGAVNALRKVQTALTAKQTVATGAQTVAQKLLNAVMKANPVFLLVGAFAALATGVAAAAKAISGSSDELEKQQLAIDNAEKALDDYTLALDKTLKVMEKMGVPEAVRFRTELEGLRNILGQTIDITKQVMALEDSKLFPSTDNIEEAVSRMEDANKEYVDFLQVVKTEAAAMAAAWDKLESRKGLTDFESQKEDLDEAAAAWEKLLRDMMFAGQLTSDEYVKASQYIYAQRDKDVNKLTQEERDRQKKLKDDKEKAAQDAAKRELEILREEIDAKIDLIKNENERAIAEENERHDRAIHKLKTRLATEKNLTEKEKSALNRLLELEEEKHQKNLSDLDWKATEKRLKDEAELVKLRLEAVEEGGQAELDLKLQQLQTLRDLELANTELTEEQKQLIRESYAKQEAELREKSAKAAHEKEMEELRLFWQNQIDEAALNKQNTLELEMQARKAELDALHQMEGESDAEFKARQLEKQKAYVDAKKALDDYEVEITQAKMSAIEGLMGGLSQIIEAFGETNEKAAKASKAIALAEIAINTGKAIAAGVAQAQSVAFPANIAAIATTVTTVLTNIASAISTVKSAKFATGGFVSGPGTGTSDSIPARLSNGESVINARSTAMFGPLLSSLNQAGGGIAFNPATGGQREGYEFLAAAVSAGMKSVRLHVGVDEVTRVQDRVARINEVSTIG